MQCDACQLWFHFLCIGVDSISEHEDYICIRCTEKRYASLVTAASQQGSARALRPPEFGAAAADSLSTDSSGDDDDDDEHMKEFYAESVDSYIIRSNRKSPGAVTSAAGEPSRSRGDRVIVLE